MSEFSDVGFGIILGILMGMILGAFVVVALEGARYPIETIQKAQQDCLIKEYYYLDEHRDFCDKLGVKP